MSSERNADPAEQPRRKRLRYQSWHRGTREMDLILGPFIDHYLSELSESELDTLERLLAVPDATVYRWLSGQESVLPQHDTAFFGRLKVWTMRLAES